MSDTAVIYYSLTSNTDFVARYIAKKTGADLIRINTIKKYPDHGFMKFFRGGRDATFGICPELEALPENLGTYATLFIGSPVWAGRISAPVRSLLAKKLFTGKQIGLFACSAGGPADKCLAQMTALLDSCTVKGTAAFVSPAQNPSESVAENADALIAAVSAP